MTPADGPVIRATDLYQLAACPHRILLDHRLDRGERAAPTPAAERLIERGLALEAQVAAELGWPAPVYPAGDFAAGARATTALMEQGVEGIYQGLLLGGRKLAIPDLLERAAGPSRWGEYHYLPGDVKAGLEPRADHALQVGFAASLLGKLQGTTPEEGFLILGDGRREPVVIGRLAEVLRGAEERVRRIIDGQEETFPFYGEACGGCHWRGRCLGRMVAAGDLSLVDGMTPTRRRILARAGVAGLGALAEIDPRAWRRGGRPALGLDQLVPQARALLSGKIEALRPLELPELGGALVVYLERDPLEGGRPGLLAWAPATAASRAEERGEAGPRVEILADDDARRQALGHLLEAAGQHHGAILHLGSETPAGLEQLWELGRLDPRAQVALETRLWNLLVSLRRGAAYLPVHRYRLEQLAAALVSCPRSSLHNSPALAGPGCVGPPRNTPGMPSSARLARTTDGSPTYATNFSDRTLAGNPLPLPGEEIPAFVLLGNLRRGVPGPWREQLEARGRTQLRRLGSILDWIRGQPLRPARKRR